MWKRAMNFLFHRQDPATVTQVDALFADNLSAHERAARASDGVARASDANRHSLEALRVEIAQRTAADRRMRPEPRTSDVRSLVETALARVQPRPDQKR